MHAFLLIGNSDSQIEKEIEALVKKHKSDRLDFELQKIAQARELSTVTRLKLDKPRSVVIKDVDKASSETLNAFLKNLEEPQKNLYYILTSSSKHKVMPTIVSRCQVIRTKNPASLKLRGAGKQHATNSHETEKFLKLSVGEKLNYVSKIKDREDAVSLIEETITILRDKLHSANNGYLSISNSLKLADITLQNLHANANVQLHLTNFVINVG